MLGANGFTNNHERPVGVDMSSDDRRTIGRVPAKGGRLQLITMIVIFDIAGPFAAYSALRSAGMSSVTALLLSGVLPALGVAIGAIQHRRLDVVGALVLSGIVVGTILGLISHSARLLLVEGSVPTTVLAVACLGSLRARRPLMFSFVLEFTGPDTARGREMTTLWQHAGFRRVFRVITTVWGAGFLCEAALRVIIVYNTPTGVALATSKILPFVFGGILSAWTVAYGTHQKRKGERMAAASDVGAPSLSPEAAQSPEPS